MLLNFIKWHSSTRFFASLFLCCYCCCWAPFSSFTILSTMNTRESRTNAMICFISFYAMLRCRSTFVIFHFLQIFFSSLLFVSFHSLPRTKRNSFIRSTCYTQHVCHLYVTVEVAVAVAVALTLSGIWKTRVSYSSNQQSFGTRTSYKTTNIKQYHTVMVFAYFIQNVNRKTKAKKKEIFIESKWKRQRAYGIKLKRNKERKKKKRIYCQNGIISI